MAYRFGRGRPVEEESAVSGIRRRVTARGWEEGLTMTGFLVVSEGSTRCFWQNWVDDVLRLNVAVVKY